MSKEHRYIAETAAEPSPSTPAQRAFFRYQYTLGSYEYRRQHGSADAADPLGQELDERYEQYRTLRDQPGDLYSAGEPPAAQPLPPEQVLRERSARDRQPDILARLEQAVGAIQDSETFRAYLAMQARFHRYSPGNVALIMAQRPDATQVAGYHAWLRLHRYVKRGEKAIKIIVPLTKKVETDDGEDERKVFFGTGNVFDVSQTDGEPLPTVDVPILYGEEGVELFWQLTALAHRETIHVEPVDAFAEPGKMGDYDPTRREIRVRQQSALQMVKTLAHELGHHFAGHGRSDPESETSAEAVAYVVCAHFGLDTGERSFPYIATWAKDQRVLQQALGTIQKVSTTIIDGIERPRRPAEGATPAGSLEQGPAPYQSPEL